jgi:alpha-L-fucosidase
MGQPLFVRSIGARTIDRRRFLKSGLTLLAGTRIMRGDGGSIASGPFAPTWASLNRYRAPEWFRDAKFGISAHWDPQSVPEDGDWYARNMYVQGMPQYDNHVARYGHPSKFGYKDLCRLWRAEHWSPEVLLETYKTTGAKYFVALANHHDGFDCWNSTFQAWNSVNIGPRRDIVGTWAESARRHGLRFGVLVFATPSWSWFNVSHESDKTGPLKGVPYDGNLTRIDGKGQWWEGYDPRSLYGPPHPEDEPPPPKYMSNFFDRSKDVIDKYRPDLVFFTDDGLPLGETGLRLAAHYYNSSYQWHGGKVEAVINTKHMRPDLQGALVWDMLPPDEIQSCPWQMDICIGDWHYKRGLHYKGTEAIVPYLVDVVSKNGNLLLNIPLRADGTFDDQERIILNQIARWISINGEALFSTRPWTIYGEGPTHAPLVDFPYRNVRYTAADVRFTVKNSTLYAIVLAWPTDGRLAIGSLGRSANHFQDEIADVELLGFHGKVQWTREEKALVIRLPSQKPCDFAYSFRVSLERRAA